MQNSVGHSLFELELTSELNAMNWTFWNLYSSDSYVSTPLCLQCWWQTEFPNMSFHILLAILACPILALGSPAIEWDTKVDFDGQNNINSQGWARYTNFRSPNPAPIQVLGSREPPEYLPQLGKSILCMINTQKLALQARYRTKKRPRSRFDRTCISIQHNLGCVIRTSLQGLNQCKIWF